MNHIQEFRDAMTSYGITPPDEIKDDGKRYRFSSNGTKGDDSGWYRLHGDDSPAGAFGCWRMGISEKWKSSEKKIFTPAEREAWKKRMRERERAAAEAEAQERAECAAKAVELWDRASPNGHPYLTRKQITGVGVRVLGDTILVPLRHGPGAIVGLQRIKPDGEKKFLSGTPADGAYHVIGKPDRNGTVVIAEGYATAVSIHMATSYCVVVAFNAGNLLSVSNKIRKAMPSAQIILAADDDAWTVYPQNHPKAGQPYNPGMEFAYDAALAVGGKLTAPIWSGDRPHKHTDFNDLHVDEGLQAVELCFNNTYDPEPKTDTEQDAGNSSPSDQPDSVSLPTAENNPGSSSEPPPFDSADTVPAQEDFTPPAADYVDDEYDWNAEDAWDINKNRPWDTASLFQKYLPENGKLVFWSGQFYLWDGSKYQVQKIKRIHQMLYRFLNLCTTIKTDQHGGRERVGFEPDSSYVEKVIHAMSAEQFTDVEDPPMWMDRRAGDPDPSDIVAFKNGFLDIRTKTLLPSSHRLFLTNCMEFDYDPSAPAPKEWLKFLDSVWSDDAQAVETLQDMLGYLMTDDTSQQKMFFFIGPPRSGKGTIIRVIESLVGKHNRAAPSLSSIGNEKGVRPLIGRRVALVSDARMSGRTDQQPIIENLLRISGEDSITIDRKYIDDWTGKLSARFVMASNEPPSFSDASGALANRFIMFRFTKSFANKEDHGLGARLLKEIPGILLWALEGLDRLRERGHFVMPLSGRGLSQEMIDASSPVLAFIRETCIIDSQGSIPSNHLYELWVEYSLTQGDKFPGNASSFSRKLMASTTDITPGRCTINGKQVRAFIGVRLRGYSDDERPI